MKKLKLSDKLSLNKDVISKLQDEQLLDIKGGSTEGCSKGNICSCTNNTCG